MERGEEGRRGQGSLSSEDIRELWRSLGCQIRGWFGPVITTVVDLSDSSVVGNVNQKWRVPVAFKHSQLLEKRDLDFSQ